MQSTVIKTPPSPACWLSFCRITYLRYKMITRLQLQARLGSVGTATPVATVWCSCREAVAEAIHFVREPHRREKVGKGREGREGREEGSCRAREGPVMRTERHAPPCTHTRILWQCGHGAEQDAWEHASKLFCWFSKYWCKIWTQTNFFLNRFNQHLWCSASCLHDHLENQLLF